MNAWQRIAVVVAAYLIGSVSFAWILAKRLKGVDLRTVGSGNLGATNAARVLGRRLGSVVYVLDFAKGLLPVVLVRALTAGEKAGASIGPVPLTILAGLAAIVGHCFPVWHQFRGGKGVATASGVVAGLTPLVAIIAGAVFGIAVLVSRRISVGSILAAAALPVAQFLLRDGPPVDVREVLIFYCALAVFVIARHHQNLRRLFRGEEPRIGARRP
jgi:glycerol-3-phosphate acyltransferase PlsY